MNFSLRALALIGAMLGPTAAGAADAQTVADPFVFSAFNQATLARFAPLPAAGTGVAGAGGRIQLDWTTETVIARSGGEDLLLDGEILRLALQYRWQLDRLTLWAEAPLLITGGGVLDRSIENWHDWFGLPNGGRDQIERDQYRYRYVRDGVTVFDIDGSDTAVGDLRAGASVCGVLGGCAAAMLQLPTGDADRFLGGALGGAAWYERAYALDAARRWSGVVAGGVAVANADGPMQDQARSVVPFGWISLGWSVTPAWSLGAQFYGHGPLYDDSKLDPLSKGGGQLSFGVLYRSVRGGRVQLAMQEDVVIESSPDFVIELAYDW